MVFQGLFQAIKQAVLGQLLDLGACPAVELLAILLRDLRAVPMFMIRMISSRSFSLGTSTKNMASNRPARRNSGGSSLMLLAVAMTSTGLVVSCIQVKK